MLQSADRYTLSMLPPVVEAEGAYDLTLEVATRVGQGEVVATSQAKAVVYTDDGDSRIDVAVVLDRSGSMSGTPLEDAKDAANLFIDQMRAGDRVALVSYSSSGTLNVALTELDSSSDSREALHNCGGWPDCLRKHLDRRWPPGGGQ